MVYFCIEITYDASAIEKEDEMRYFEEETSALEFFYARQEKYGDGQIKVAWLHTWMTPNSVDGRRLCHHVRRLV